MKLSLKLLSLAIIAGLLAGCVTATYKNGNETFRVTSLFKSVEGLSASKGDGFEISIAKTESETEQMQTMMIQMMQLYMSMPK
jgi:hypothetical protein